MSILTKLPKIINKATNRLMMFDGTLSRPTKGGAFDYGTGTWSGAAPLAFTFRGLVNTNTQFFMRTDTERVGNLAIIALGDPSTWTPTTVPVTNDIVTCDGETGVVQRVHTDPATATYVLDCLAVL